MKALKIFALACALVAIPVVAMAGVTGGKHDLTGWAGSGGAKPLCEACHTPHNALGDNLWGSTVGTTYSAVGNLCYTCHDGSVTTAGTATAFNTALEQHKVTVGNDCSGDASSCHDVHNEGTGSFLLVAIDAVSGTYCVTCHDDTNEGGLGDHTAGMEHYTSGTTFNCNDCHSAHGAANQTAPIAGLTHPILLEDNMSSGYGQFCIDCHNDANGYTIVADNFDYNETTNGGAETKHPTYTTGGSFPIGGCNECHDVHAPASADNGHILIANNDDSAFCVSCHSGGTAPAFGGAASHPAGVAVASNTMNTSAGPALPWADQINEDGNAGADYSGTADFIVCETCHSVHRVGLATSSFFLREDNGAQNELCVRCHTAN